MRSIDNSAGNLQESQVELYREFERVIVDPEQHVREIEEELEEEKRLSAGVVPQDQPSKPISGGSYAQRVLALIRKPHAQWSRDDYALAARVVEEARFTGQPTQHQPRDAERQGMNRVKRTVVRDEFDRRLWGLPPRPRLSHNN
jgi:hypothetical protein